MSQATEDTDLQIDELVADFVIKKISRKEKRHSSKHKHKYKKKKSKSKNKYKKYSSSDYDSSTDEDRRSHSSSIDSSRSHKKGHRSKHKAHKHRHRESSTDSHGSEKYSKKRKHYDQRINRKNSLDDKETPNRNLKNNEIKKISMSTIHDDIDDNTFNEKTITNVKLDSCPSEIPQNLDVSCKLSEADVIPSSKDTSQDVIPQQDSENNLLFNIDINAIVKTVVSNVIVNKGENDEHKPNQTENNSSASSIIGTVDVKSESLRNEKSNVNIGSLENTDSTENNDKIDLTCIKVKTEKIKKSHSGKRKHRSRSRESERTYDRYKRYSRSRSRSRDREKYRYKSERNYFRGRNNDRNNEDRSRKYSQDRNDEYEIYQSHRRSNSWERKEKKRSDKEKIDKAKLLEVARKNVLTMIERGTLPQGIEIDALKKEQLLTLKSGGHSVKELTDFCRTLSEKERYNIDIDSSSHRGVDEHDDSGQPFIHHPFKIKETSIIKLNIKNSVSLPIKTHAEKITENARTLSLQFPVSSGDQHRQKELEWIPVEKKSDTKSSQPVTKMPSTSKSQTPVPALPPPPLPPSLPSTNSSLPAPPPLPSSPSLKTLPPLPPLPPPLPPPPPPPSMTTSLSHSTGFSTTVTDQPPLPSALSVEMMNPVYSDTMGYFGFQMSPAAKPKKHINLHAIVAKRFQALQKLNQNPSDINALRDIQEAQHEMQAWVESQHIPGQFTGSTNAKVLSVTELCGPRPVWARKDIFTKAAPVTEGKGMALLRKMGWNPGEGLGKNKEGALEPLFLDIKMDKKGLVTSADKKKLIIPFSMTQATDKQKDALQGKHPVSVLMELCSKKKWPPPLYTEVVETGPSHKRAYLFKVQVNEIEYQPAVTQNIKKTAKVDAAMAALKSLGIVPND